MSQHPIRVFGLIVTLCFCAGCQSGSYRMPGGSALFSRKSVDKNKTESPEETKTREEQLAGQTKDRDPANSASKQQEPKKEDNPFIATLQKNQPDNQTTNPFESRVSPAGGSSANGLSNNLITPASASKNGGTGIHDAKTLMLIESEIRELPPEQQQEMRNVLASVPADQVPQILKIRKLLAQQGQTQNSPPAQPQLQNRPTTRPVANTINDVSPWAQSTTTAKGPELMGIEDVYDEKTLGSPQPAPQLKQNELPMISAGFDENPLLKGKLPPADNNQHPLNNQFTAGQLPPTGNFTPQVSNNVPLDLNQLNQHSLPPIGMDNGFNNQIPAMQASLNNGSSHWKDDLQKLIATAETEFSQMKPGAGESEKMDYVAKQVYLRMLYLMGGQEGRATQVISELAPADQEFWQQTMWAFHNYFDQKGIPQEADRANQAISQLQSAISSLQNKAQLEIRNVNFCQKITSFGNYEKFDRQEFQPGEPVLIYSEIRNFSSEPTTDGQYRTTLKSTIEIHKAGPQGGLVSQFEFPPTIDTCRNRRQDYFHSYMVNIPERATMGPHVLKLTVEDQVSHKLTTYTMNFNVK